MRLSTFHWAVNPFSSIFLLTGKNAPLKLGFTQLDSIFTSVCLPKGLKLSHWLPFSSIFSLNVIALLSSRSMLHDKPELAMSLALPLGSS